MHCPSGNAHQIHLVFCFTVSIILSRGQSAERVFFLLVCPATMTTRQASAFSSSKRRNRLARPPSGASGMSAFSTRGDSVASERLRLFAPGCARTVNTVAIAFSPKPSHPRKGAAWQAFHRKDLPAQAGIAGCSAALGRPRRENAPGNEREIFVMPARASAGN